ncbi:unnamed protein product [Dovyalis caffra]|uniref:DYW domain-containing protein n=1 Tax=Dovyalis caffra TaxID=77055 RepID=A0AAV1QN13_9ROSI|nr:unnamed protein product [Dovyalis caffra]
MIAFSCKFSTATANYLTYISLKRFPPKPRTFTPLSQIQQQCKQLECQLVSTLDGCENLNQIKQVHAHILLNGLDQSCYVLAKLIRMFTKFNIPLDPYPRPIFNRVKYPNPFLYTALIRGYLIEARFNESIELYSLMRKEGVGPVSFTFTSLFKACGANMDVGLGQQIHGQTIVIGGFGADLHVGNSMIEMYIKCGFLECGRKLFDEMPKRDVISWTELIVAYGKSGNMESACELFDGLPVKDMVAWTAMVSGFAQNAKPREAITFFEKMLEFGVETDEITLVSVISACAQLGAAKYADWIHDVAEKSGFCGRHSVLVGSALIDMYSKCGSVGEACRVFEGMKERNVYSYSSMILGFAMHGRARDAMDLFDEMVKTEVKPNRVTFIGVLTACSHAGMVEQGQEIFELMEKRYGIKPSAAHYTCMVDLLGRAGRLQEAHDLVKTMPIEPHGGVWGALLGACRIHKNPDVAAIAANHLFELEPNCIGNYILLANIYASSGRWNDVSTIRKLMRTRGLKKNPAFSWIESEKGMVHEFFSWDMTHPRSGEIKRALEDLLDRLEGKGYQPNFNSVPYDMNDEDKRRILMTHSEKLALAFGLISTTPGSDIRIVKNIRICEDCHSVMCGASQITGREIVVRDNMRFHHFHDGTCSCGGFW